MTRGRRDSLRLHRGGLSPPTPCRSPGAPHYFSPPGFKYEFAVTSAKVNYIGDLNFSLTRQIEIQPVGNMNLEPKHVLGMDFQMLDQQDRDAPLFDAQFPAYSQKDKLWCDGCALRNP